MLVKPHTGNNKFIVNTLFDHCLWHQMRLNDLRGARCLYSSRWHNHTHRLLRQCSVIHEMNRGRKEKCNTIQYFFSNGSQNTQQNYRN